MSAKQGSTKAPAPSDSNGADATKDQPQQKPAAALEEDDEFEDFPVEDWPQEDTELPSGNTHLWEESWDDDDTSDDFSAQLKEEVNKVNSSKRS